MGLKSWLGLNKQRFVSDLLTGDVEFSSLYRDGIQAAQGGRFDNLHKQMRYFVMSQLAKQADPQFDFAECGCLWGHSTYMLAQIIEANGAHGRLHVFDSFEGLSEFGGRDFRAAPQSEERTQIRRKRYASDYETVTNTVAKFPFVDLYKGWIPTRFGEIENKRFSFVSIDVDLFQPTLDSLEFFFPRLVDGGIIYFDDYGGRKFPGAKAAVDQYLAEKSVALFMRMPFPSAFLKK